VDKAYIFTDDSFIRKYYERILNKFGFEVIGISNNKDDAIEMFLSFKIKPEIFLIDYEDSEDIVLEISRNLKL